MRLAQLHRQAETSMLKITIVIGAVRVIPKTDVLLIHILRLAKYRISKFGLKIYVSNKTLIYKTFCCSIRKQTDITRQTEKDGGCTRDGFDTKKSKSSGVFKALQVSQIETKQQNTFHSGI
jgi:hypothetical protein